MEKISDRNLNDLAELMLALWEKSTFQEEYRNCERILSSANEICFLSKTDKEYTGFIYISLRNDYVEGAVTKPVAYIEGLYVKPAFRRTGTGKELVAAGAAWGKEMGCSEYASDAAMHNDVSLEFHRKQGFREVNRIVCL